MQKSMTLLILLLILLPQSGAQESTKEGTMFKVRCTFSNEAVCAATLDTAEQTWIHANKVFGALKVKMAGPWQITVYPTPADFEAACAQLGGFTKGHWSHYDAKNRQLHLALDQAPGSEALTLCGLPISVRRNLAWQVMRLYQGFAYPSIEKWPLWLWNGQAAYGAELSLVKMGASQGDDKDPAMGELWGRLQDLLKADSLPLADDVVKGNLSEAQKALSHNLHHSLYQSLASGKTKSAFQTALDKAAKTKAADEAAIVKVFTTAIKTDVLNTEWRNLIRGMKCQWREPTPSMQSLGAGTWLQIGGAETAPAAFSTTAPTSSSYRLSGELRVFSGKEKQANIFLGDVPRGAVIVTITPGVGVSVLQTLYADNSSSTLSTIEMPDLPLDKVIPFECAVNKSTLNLSVNGQNLGSVDLGSHDMSGRWGLGAYFSTAVEWRKLAVM